MKDPSVSRLRKAGWSIFGVLLFAGGIALVVSVLRDNSVSQPRVITTVMRVMLPPPPPPTPPPPTPPPPEKMMERPKVTEQVTKPLPKPLQPKPSAAKPAAVPSPPSSPLTADAAPGPNPYGLAVGNGDGNVIGGGGGGGDGGSRFGYYNNLVESQVRSALQQDDKTRFGRYRLIVRIWLDATGKVTRTKIENSNGDVLIDSTITKILSVVSVGEGPPQDMPQPVNIRIGAQS